MAKRAQSAPRAFTVSGDLIRGLSDCAVRCGLPRMRLADMLKEEGRPSPPPRYAAEHILKLWDRVIRLSADPVIGFRMALVAE